MDYAVKVNNFYYQNLFDNFSLLIEKNKIVTLSGPNNCGKTTLIRILNREIIVDTDIEIFGRKINDYTIHEYASFVGCVIPLEKVSEAKNLEEEMYFYHDDMEDIEWIVSGLKLRTIRRKNLSSLSSKDFILYQLAVELSKDLKILLIDDIHSYFTKSELSKIVGFLKKYQEKKNITIVFITNDLEQSLVTDYLYIIGDKKISLQGFPMEVLENDNRINKIGLNLPFMVDLSVKLRDYKLLDYIELDKERMVDTLWK